MRRKILDKYCRILLKRFETVQINLQGNIKFKNKSINNKKCIQKNTTTKQQL